jgi:NAD-dependent dihydropyrimidine dehydrogenase PreA subunit
MLNAYATNTLQYDQSLCIGCGVCVDVCPHAAFEMKERLAYLVNAQACMECGACQLNCPVNAIRVQSGVGCAAALTRAALLGQKEESCSCG